jgi:hypothetical protein
VDVTAARMLMQPGDDLERQDARMVMARDTGQVRDVLRRTEGSGYRCPPTRACGEAIAALSGRP